MTRQARRGEEQRRSEAAGSGVESGQVAGVFTPHHPHYHPHSTTYPNPCRGRPGEREIHFHANSNLGDKPPPPGGQREKGGSEKKATGSSEGKLAPARAGTGRGRRGINGGSRRKGSFLCSSLRRVNLWPALPPPPPAPPYPLLSAPSPIGRRTAIPAPLPKPHFHPQPLLTSPHFATFYIPRHSREPSIFLFPEPA